MPEHTFGEIALQLNLRNKLVHIYFADVLEQLGAVAILRTVSKVGRDTRFTLFSDALRVLRDNLENLPQMLRLDTSRKQALPRLTVLQTFLEAAEQERNGLGW